MKDINIVDHKTIELATNWVLIKPDEETEYFHLNGKRTSILVGRSAMKYFEEEDSFDFDMRETVDNHADHWPITGQVIAAPKKITFYGHEAERKKKEWGDSINPDDLQHLTKLQQNSSNVASDVEVQVGDQVIFDYMAVFNAMEGGLFVVTDIGVLVLVKYDRLIGRVRGEEIYPLNNQLFFEWKKPVVSELIITLDKEISDVEYGKAQVGVLTHVGKDFRYYYNYGEFMDFPTDFSVGDKIYFNPIETNMIEAKQHLTIFGGKEIYVINRSRVLAKE